MSHCYVAIKKDRPGAYAACADLEDMPAETAKFVATEIKRGAKVERVTTEKARSMLGEYVKWQKEQERLGNTHVPGLYR